MAQRVEKIYSRCAGHADQKRNLGGGSVEFRIMIKGACKLELRKV